MTQLCYLPKSLPSLSFTPKSIRVKNPSHISPITTAVGPVAASGSINDTIYVYDLSSASSLGSLHDHTASITALFLHSSLPLISSQPHLRRCWWLRLHIRRQSFHSLEIISAHKKSVNNLLVHPSAHSYWPMPKIQQPQRITRFIVVYLIGSNLYTQNKYESVIVSEF